MVYAETEMWIEALTATKIHWLADETQWEEEIDIWIEKGRTISKKGIEILAKGQKMNISLYIEGFDLEGNIAKQIAESFYDKEHTPIGGMGYIMEGEIKLTNLIYGRYWPSYPLGHMVGTDLEDSFYNNTTVIKTINKYLTKKLSNYIINWNQRLPERLEEEGLYFNASGSKLED